MKILLVIRKFGLGGTERRMEALYKHISASHECKKYELTDVPTEYVLDGQTAFTKDTYKKKWQCLKNEIHAYQPDVIHCFDLETSIYCKTILLFNRRAVLIAGFGSSVIESKIIRSLIQLPFFQPDIFICNSKKGVKYLKETLSIKTAIEFIPNGLSATDFSEQFQATNYFPDNNPIIGYIGKFDSNKRADRMMDIALELKEHPLRPNFILVGTGPLLQEAKKRAQEIGMEKRIVFTGLTEKAHLIARSFDAAVLCSDLEGFPNVLVEYMAMGIPFVTTNAGDSGDIVTQHQCGILVEKFSAGEFAKEIINLLENETLRYTLSALGKKTFTEQYTIETMSKRYLEVYQRMLKLN
jgi:glycosyltransferase involved in cell wall biosynthesis